ncbi:putative acetyltransferase protein [Roseibacterium elongatum DSM 19469]|uniref:Putative acetyltransferase protein n=1 Tax=Roseicyclus elongatus DSM 19469 TaxID=1294273 RepID=W8S8F4_9RHOB|nr:putative acetyltransferase protein [Roseibacterium elongatum DSM 19469]
MTAPGIGHWVETNPSDFDDWDALLQLLGDCFAGMEGRIDPPSSLNHLTAADLARKSETGDLFLMRITGRPVACAFGLATPACYHVGKLAVAAPQRGQGMAREILDAAARAAGSHGLTCLEVQTRVELRENHRLFRRLGFSLVAGTSHAGHSRARSLTFRRAL